MVNTMINNYTYEGIIKRLLKGWKPNHHHGELMPEWWHEHRGLLSPMRDDELAIIKTIETSLDKETIRLLNNPAYEAGDEYTTYQDRSM